MRWTDQEIEKLRQYTSQGLSPRKMVALEPHWTERAIISKSSRISLSTVRNNAWAETDLARLRDIVDAGATLNDLIAAFPQRTPRAIETICHRYDLHLIGRERLKWKPEEIALIRHHAGDMPTLLQLLPNRTKSAIQSLASTHGISFKTEDHPSAWSDEEIQIIRDFNLQRADQNLSLTSIQHLLPRRSLAVEVQT